MLPTVRLGFNTRVLPEKIFLLNCSEGGVGVRAADHAKAVWVHTETFLQLQTSFESLTGVLVLEH